MVLETSTAIKEGTTMADWTKKIMKAVGGDLAADEQLEDGMFVNPAGTTAGMLGVQAGGVIGAAIATKAQMGKDATSTIVSNAGRATGWPAKPVVVGLTSRRMILWSHGQMSGKPKEFIGDIPLSEIAGIDVDKHRATFSVTVRFTDGGGVELEAPKIANKPERFAATFTRLTGR